MSWKETLGHFGVEISDDEEQPKAKQPQKQASAPVPVAPGPVAVPFPATPLVSAAVVDHNDDVYQRLFSKTDFKTTAVFAAIQKYLTPLASLPLDEKTKFKTAVLQAQAQENVSAEVILSTFDSLKSTLVTEQSNFQKAMAQANDREVTARQSKIQELTAQMQDLQNQIQTLTNDAFTAQQKIQTAEHKFDIAFNARSAELEAEKTQYNSMLQ